MQPEISQVPHQDTGIRSSLAGHVASFAGKRENSGSSALRFAIPLPATVDPATPSTCVHILYSLNELEDQYRTLARPGQARVWWSVVHTIALVLAPRSLERALDLFVGTPASVRIRASTV